MAHVCQEKDRVNVKQLVKYAARRIWKGNKPFLSANNSSHLQTDLWVYGWFIGLWGLLPQQQPGSHRGGVIMMMIIQNIGSRGLQIKHLLPVTYSMYFAIKEI